MPAGRNRRVLLASRPRGEPKPEDFELVEAEVPEPGPGQMLLRTIYLSLDPYMRGRMDAGPSYAPPVEVGAVLEGGTVCEVVASDLPKYRPGDIVLAERLGNVHAPSIPRRPATTEAAVVHRGIVALAPGRPGQ